MKKLNIRRGVDWEHSVTDKMDSCKNIDGCPQPEDFGTTEADVKDYVYDKQRVLDREEERKTNLVVPGIILVMPVIIMSGFGEGTELLLGGVLAGVILMLAYFAIMKALDKRKIAGMYDKDIENYIEALERFDAERKDA